MTDRERMRALAIGRGLARLALRDRRGHGGARALKRVLSEDELADLLEKAAHLMVDDVAWRVCEKEIIDGMTGARTDH